MSDRLDTNCKLEDATTSFLGSLSQEKRTKAQEQLHKFVQWGGQNSNVSDLTASAVARYGAQSLVNDVQFIKAFLSYLKKKGLHPHNLSTHLKVRKPSRTTVISVSRGKRSRPSLLTSSGYSDLSDELEKLKVQRSQVTVELRKAAADKDFRENAPLHAAREKKSYIEGRIQEIENVLKKVHIVDGSAGTTTVKAGYTVELEEVMSGKQRIFMLVGSKEANPSRGKLSIESPIGKELLNKEIDDTVKVTAPAGTFEYRIKSIKPSS